MRLHIFWTFFIIFLWAFESVIEARNKLQPNCTYVACWFTQVLTPFTQYKCHTWQCAKVIYIYTIS